MRTASRNHSGLAAAATSQSSAFGVKSGVKNRQQCLDLLEYTWLYENVCVENEFRIGWRRCLGVEPSLDQAPRATVLSPACM